MKLLQVAALLFCTASLNANFVTDTIDNMGNNLKEYRTYPRMEKAKSFIAKGELEEAKKLLEKVLEIDSSNPEASKMLVTLCLQKKDFSCAKRYVHTVKPKIYAIYYEMSLLYGQKKYKEAYKLALLISDDSALKKEEKAQKDMILLKSAILSKNKQAVQKYLPSILHTSKNNMCRPETSDIIALLLEQKMLDEAIQEIFSYLEKCKKDAHLDEKRIVWADILRDNDRTKEALRIVNAMGDSIQKYKQQLLIFIKNENYKDAAETMEKIYRFAPNPSNKKRMAYLYEKAGMNHKIKALYAKEYQATKNASDLKKLLYMNKERGEEFRILKQYYPYRGLSKDEKFNFSSTLIEKYTQMGNNRNEILTILDDLSALKDLSPKQKAFISFQYHKQNSNTKAIRILEALYAANPTEEYRKRLLFLYDKTKGYTKKKESLLLANANSRCERNLLLPLLDIKQKSKRVLKRLELDYPFNCLKSKEKLNAMMILLRDAKKRGNIQKARRILTDMSRMSKLSKKDLLTLAYEFSKYKEYDVSNKMANRVLKKDPKNFEALKIIAENHYALKHYSQARQYFQKAYKLHPKKYELAKVLGELYSRNKAYKQALYYWDQYLKHKHSKQIILKAADQALQMDDAKRARGYLSKLSRPVVRHERKYYTLKAKLAELENDNSQALAYYRKALKYGKNNTDTLYRYANLLAKEERYKEAITYVKKIIPHTRDKAKYFAQIGYWSQQYGKDEEAALAFKKALKYQKDPKYYKALGYSEVKLKHHENAVNSFKRSLDLLEKKGTGTASEKYNLKRSIKYMEDSFTGYFAYVSSNTAVSNVSPIITDDTIGGYSALRLSYTPRSYTDRLQFYLNTAVGIKNKNITMADGTTQPSVGVSYQITNDTMIIVSVEKLIKGGSRSRDDVLARISGKFFDDYSFDPVLTSKWFKSLYIDIAYFFDHDSYRFYSKYEHGYMQKINYQNAWMPYISASIAYDNDNDTKKSMYNYDIGLGLSYLFWLDEEKYRSHTYTGRASVEARKAFKTKYENDDQIQMMLELLF
ncbi:tetratricopeptide repeat protein [Sulfurovum sp.]|uniref:tetratricopeptide repeat protein n=1 Tax=Sulfurovum sp. TaxID=1969726 RepID=UPI0025D481BC|nr:tetratricopeptide repeat protein [Sulfurovum sp.]